MAHEETKTDHEAVKQSPNFDVVVARHAEYYDVASENKMYQAAESLPEAERQDAIEAIKVKLGRLTERGHEQARQLGLDILHDALKSGQPLDITFIASKQLYESPRFPDAPWGGRRAVETADEAIGATLEEIGRLVESGEIAADQVRVLTPLPAQPFEEGQMPNQRLVERDVYYSPLSKESLVDAYKKRAQEIVAKEQETGQSLTSGYDMLAELALSETLALSNREKEIWSRGQTDLDELGNRIGNETSTDVANRTMGVIEDMAELAKVHKQHNPERRLVAVLVAHDAVVSALSYQAFATEKPVIPTFAKRLNIHVRDGVANLEYDGKEYPKRLTPSEH